MPIRNSEGKLEAFTEAVCSKAIEDSDNIVKELDREKKDMLGKKQSEIEDEAERYVLAKISEIHAREGNKLSSHINENKRTLLQFREDCANEIYDAVKLKIRGFTESEEYLPQLKALLQKAVELMGYGFVAEVQLRPADMKYAEVLGGQVSGVSLAFVSGDFELGGLRLYCPAKSKRIDLSFDEALEDMMCHFAEITGLMDNFVEITDSEQTDDSY